MGANFVARMDSKADRKEGKLIIHNIHVEPLSLKKSQVVQICDAIRNFAKFNRCVSIVVEKSNEKTLMKALRTELSDD